MEQLENCCIGLDSFKVTERRKYADTLRELIIKPEICKSLNNGECRRTWDAVYLSVHRFIKKEGEKLYQDESKQSSQVKTLNYRSKSDLLKLVTNKANSGEYRLTASKVVDTCLECFYCPYQKRFFGDVYLSILNKDILSVSKYWGKIGNKNWKEIFSALKRLYKNPENLDLQLITKALHLTIKHGTKHSSLNLVLSQEFGFIKDISTELNNNSCSTQHEEIILHLLIEFCVQLSKECRMSVCKLGEEVSHNLIQKLFCLRLEKFGGKKSLIYDFLLLQLRIHHPRGAAEGNDSAFATNWDKWRKLLPSLYSVLCSELEIIQKQRITSNTQAELWPNLLQLIVEVANQVFKNEVFDISQNSILNTSNYFESSHVTKRPRLEIGIPAIISAIQCKDNWPWLSFLANLIQNYPTIIKPEEFLNILEIVSNSQVDSYNTVNRHYSYALLIEMIKAQDKILNNKNNIVSIWEQERLDSLWTKVWETALRSAGLNQNEETTHKLLQIMMEFKKTVDFLSILSIFTSNAVNISEHSLKTIYILFTITGVPDDSTRLFSIKTILTSNNDKIFTEKSTVQILTGLVLKQWPYTLKKITNVNTIRDYQTIEDIYIKSCFEGGLLIDDYKQIEMEIEDNLHNNHLVHNLVLEELCNKISSFGSHLCEITSDSNNTLIVIIRGLSLIIELISELINFNISNMNSVSNFLKLGKILKHLHLEIKRQNILKLEVFQELETLLTLKVNSSVAAWLREEISNEFLKFFVDLLNADEVDGADDMDEVESCKTKNKLTHHEELQLGAFRFLARYCCVPDSEIIIQRQKHVLQLLMEPFTVTILVEFKMSIYFIQALNNCQIGILPDTTVAYMLQSLQKLMEVKYEDYDSAQLLLQILQDLIPHVHASKSKDLKVNLLSLLHPFYDRKESYGPLLYIKIINCMEEIIKIDSLNPWPNSFEVKEKLLNFLKCDFHQVRLEAIKAVLNLFKVHPNTTKECIDIQIQLLKELNKKMLESFEVFNNLDNIQIIDETANRTAGALHIYASFVSVNSYHRKSVLFSMLKLIVDKKINIDLVRKVFGIIVKHLNIKNVDDFLDSNVNYLIVQWYKTKGSISDLPFQLFQCENQKEFCKKYKEYTVPILLQENNNMELLQTICAETHKSLSDLITECYPSIFAQFLPIFVYSKASNLHKITAEDVATSKQVLNKLNSLTNCDPNIIENIDLILIKLLNRFFDLQHLKTQFDLIYLLPETDPPVFNQELIKATLQHIEGQFLDGSNIIRYIFEKCPYKLEQILFTVTTNLYKYSFVEDQLLFLHRFTFFVDLVSDQFVLESEMNLFIIRSVINHLMGLLKSNKVISLAVCKYLKKFLSKCLPFAKRQIEQFFVSVVSNLVPIAKENNELGDECLNVLSLLIVENSKHLYDSIGALDSFPNEAKFENIQSVYQKIKYGNDEFNLEQEIRHFLNVGKILENCDRTEGLQHLQSILVLKKNELNDLYLKLNKMNSYCCDSDESILHQLICMLMELTKSPIEQVKLAATKCLGELGPTDLTTLVLKPEKSLPNLDLTPIDLVTAQIIIYLTKYLNTPNISLMEHVSNVLYAICSSQDVRQLINTHNKVDFGYGILEKEFIIPFVSKPAKKSIKYSINETIFQSMINRNDLWHSEESHSIWIINLVASLLKTFPEQHFLQKLIPVCHEKVEFAENLLPLVIFLVISENKTKCTEIICEKMKYFFAKHWNALVVQKINEKLMFLRRDSMQCMLNVVNYVRLQLHIFEYSICEILDLNFLHVAQIAQFCSSYFTSIFYAELFCFNKLNSLPYDTENRKSVLEIACEDEPTEITLALENVLREGYKNIGVLDAIHGCGTGYILNTESRIEYYKNIGRWDKVVLYNNTTSDFQKKTDLVVGLKNIGMHCLALNTATDNELNSKFECAWRLSQWNLSSNDLNTKENLNFEYFHYEAMKLFHENDLYGLNNAVAEARNAVINSIACTSLESSKSLYLPLVQLQMLQEFKELITSIDNQENFQQILKKWTSIIETNQNEFHYIEPIRIQRLVLLKELLINKQKTEVKPILIDLYLKLSEEARLEGFLHVSQQALDTISSLGELSIDVISRIRFEQAQLLWLDDKISSRYLVKHLLNQSGEISVELYGRALKLYAGWMVETRSENPSAIIENYFEKAVEVCSQSEIDVENQCDVMNSLAKFADAQYQHFKDYMDSSAFKSKLEIIAKFKDMAEKIKNKDNTKDEIRAIQLYLRQSKIDETEVNNASKEKDMYLLLAIKNYLQILEYCDLYNLTIFRVLSLSLDNKANAELLECLKETLPKITSYKYIPLLPQLVPHIGNNSMDLFENIIQELLERCSIDHPHHTLPVILGLADSYKDRIYDQSTSSDSTNEPRVQVAKNLIKKLRKKQSLNKIINNMELLSNALVSLAYLDATKCTKRSNSNIIPRGEPIKMIRHFDNVLVPTINVPVKKNCDYSQIVGIREFSTKFSLVGGINAPKKISCFGTDGIERIQLVKGKDDLRQDAVMQQVFKILNNLLAKNKQTRKLLIRTYKVVPLSQRSGIIEWCENTEPLGSYLNEAHIKYHPHDWSPNECRNQLKSVHAKDPSLKYNIYKKICSNFRPIFHMFFIQSYPQAPVWFERRRAYMHSVATNSMIGYILGLGDRHVHNILLDRNTAEVIHIDFGIAFEQGKCLPTPETVPFRLTRDIEAGMGVCGVEGVFRRSCEKTLQVLRSNSETVLTILQVLLYDPLYVWTITPTEAYSRQRDDDERSINFSDEEPTNINVTAERVLLRLKEKLQGMENGAVCSLEGQVELVIQQARDPVNLSRLYNGWQPYL